MTFFQHAFVYNQRKTEWRTKENKSRKMLLCHLEMCEDRRDSGNPSHPPSSVQKCDWWIINSTAAWIMNESVWLKRGMLIKRESVSVCAIKSSANTFNNVNVINARTQEHPRFSLSRKKKKRVCRKQVAYQVP